MNPSRTSTPATLQPPSQSRPLIGLLHHHPSPSLSSSCLAQPISSSFSTHVPYSTPSPAQPKPRLAPLLYQIPLPVSSISLLAGTRLHSRTLPVSPCRYPTEPTEPCRPRSPPWAPPPSVDPARRDGVLWCCYWTRWQPSCPHRCQRHQRPLSLAWVRCAQLSDEPNRTLQRGRPPRPDTYGDGAEAWRSLRRRGLAQQQRGFDLGGWWLGRGREYGEGVGAQRRGS
ncbi:hypothetical protein IWZ00DRAFT_312820 [Phyllosticta capitalensis]|uniref:uncharacterized protein n=1 Tax=Phyllosticta capitalensis TaxID=121624 RepID=UPI00312CFEF5